MKKKQVQPKPQPGKEFFGWAPFNWGICHGTVFRTRKHAKEYCIDSRDAHAKTWDDVKGYYHIAKVKVTVL